MRIILFILPCYISEASLLYLQRRRCINAVIIYDPFIFQTMQPSRCLSPHLSTPVPGIVEFYVSDKSIEGYLEALLYVTTIYLISLSMRSIPIRSASVKYKPCFSYTVKATLTLSNYQDFETYPKK